MDNRYLNRKMIGWLSYNPNYESRAGQSTNNNKVCYFYPRYLLQNGSYFPIDSKLDFPQVGRIAVWVQGGDDAESVASRYGSLVTATLNRSLESNYESNNHYTARYNYDYGPKSSEIWLSSPDSSAFYEVVECFQSIDNILVSRQINVPSQFTGTSKYILLNNHRTVIGPFAYIIQNNKLQLLGIPSFDFMVGEYPSQTIESACLTVLDNQDKEAAYILPVELLTHPNKCKAQYDLISEEDLLTHFLEQAKIKLDLNRKEFREIKDYITSILRESNAIDFTDARLKRLQHLLPKICDVQNHVLDTFTSLMTTPEVSTVIVQELLKKYPNTLKESLASALGTSFTPSSSSQASPVLADDSKTNIALPAIALPYEVINSFFTNQHISTVVNIMQDASKELSAIIDKVHEGNQIINNEDVVLEDFMSSPNFYPEYRQQLMQQLNCLYNCMDNITTFIDQTLGHDSDKSIDDSNPSAVALNELSIKLSRAKDRLNRRAEMLNNDVTAEEIDLTLDSLDKSSDLPTEIQPVQCTLNDVLHNANLFTEHSTAIVQRDYNRSRKMYDNMNKANDLEVKLGKMQDEYDRLESQVGELEERKQEQETALSHISENLEKMLTPYKDRYQAAAKLLDMNMLQSINPMQAIQVNGAPVLHLDVNASSQSGAVAQVMASHNEQAKAINTSSIVKGIAGNALPSAIDQKVVLDANGEILTLGQTDMPSVDGEVQSLDQNAKLRPLFNPELLDNPEKFTTRKQIIDQLSVFFNKHASRSISNNEIANYLICITQSFITTFAGEPGTGKTSLCNLLARSLGLVREDQNNRFVEISVERGWTSVKDFIGYYNPLTRRMEKSNAEVFDAFYELNKEALALHSNAKDENHLTSEQLAPYFILLDEANLSPIEHYWASFFRNCDDISKQQRTISLGGKANWFLPENLRFLATINIDHTTEELSARFLDRSWVITLNPQKIDLDSSEANDELLFKDKIVPFASLKKMFSPQAEDSIPKDIANTWQSIQEIFSSSECSLPIRPRNLRMIHNYCLVASSCMNCHGDYGRLAPLDYAVAQKILPTINGNGDRYRILIEKLREVCQPELMPLCAKHLERMQRTGGAELGFYQFFSR